MTRSWIFRTILSGLLLLIAVGILLHPIATNDGPVHVAFAHLMLSYHQPSQPLQSEAYVLHLRPNPNLGVYFLMAALMRVLSPLSAESIIQLLCILGPVMAGCFALRMINRRNVWLSIFFLPLALNQMFFLGLYNHCISIAAFLLVIGAYFWLSRVPSYPRAVALAGSLVLTFLCHASGFLMAFCSIAAMILTHTLLSYSRKRELIPALSAQRFAILAMVLPLPLGALFLASGEKSITQYGFTFPYRVKQFAELHLLSANYPLRDRFVAMLLSALLLSSFIAVCIRVFSRRTPLPQHRRDQAIAAIMATFIATVIVFAFPDIMGGGWTHFRRFEIFPFFWMVLVLAFIDWPQRAFVAFTAVAAFASVFLIASMSVRQRMVREQMEPLAEVDKLVGAHCSVLPVVLQAYLMDPGGNPDLMDYQPFFQAASRLELHDDRVVLFNYLARLPPYPVHFRPGIEPQANIFHWEPEHMPNDVEQVDIRGFEAGSGMRVDYILLWGTLDRRPPEMRVQVQNATQQFVSIYKSRNNLVELYQRQGSRNPACTLDNSPRP